MGMWLLQVSWCISLQIDRPERPLRSTRNSLLARCALVVAAPSVPLNYLDCRPWEGSSWCRRSPSWPRRPRWSCWDCDAAHCFRMCWRRLIFAKTLSSSLSLASSGAVVKWDVLDDMGNYFLMLGMAMGPHILPDFASIGKIFRRCHFLLFVCFFVARGGQTQEWGRRWLNLRACYHFPPLFLNWYRWQRFQMTSQMVSHMQVRPSSMLSWPLQDPLKGPNPGSDLSYKTSNGFFCRNSVILEFHIKKTPFLHNLAQRPLNGHLRYLILFSIFTLCAPVARAATVGFNGEIWENAVPIFF